MKPLTIPTFNVTEAIPYRDILREVRTYMSRNHTDLVKQEELTSEHQFLFKQLMDTYIKEHNLVCSELSNKQLIDTLYMDMKEYSFLTPYLTAEKIEEIGLEEIEINSWNKIFIKTAKQGKIRLQDTFLDAQHALDVVKKLLQKSNMVMDHGVPYALGHLGKNQRIAAFQPPILDEEIGVCANIRIVSFSKLTRENLILWNTATDEMLDFLEMCLRYGVSMCISGRTSSGKTGTAGYLLSVMTQDDTFHVLTIEEGSREFDLIRRDKKGRIINDVVHTITVKSDDEKKHISQNTLLEQLLRHTPDILGIGEMRSVEAYTAIEAALTDHTIVTTTHAKSAELTYNRMVMLAAKGTNAFEEASLFYKAIEAFPIIVYQKKLADGSRRIMRIFEGTGYENGKLKGNTLYQYKVHRTEYDASGKAIVIGGFEKVSPISKELRERLTDEGVPYELLERFL